MADAAAFRPSGIHNAEDSLTRETDRLGRKARHEYDAPGRLRNTLSIVATIGGPGHSASPVPTRNLSSPGVPRAAAFLQG